MPSAPPPRPSWELTLTISGITDEHASYNIRLLTVVERLFKLDGADVLTSLSAERNRDGQERIYELLVEDGPHSTHVDCLEGES